MHGIPIDFNPDRPPTRKYKTRPEIKGRNTTFSERAVAAYEKEVKEWREWYDGALEYFAQEAVSQGSITKDITKKWRNLPDNPYQLVHLMSRFNEIKRQAKRAKHKRRVTVEQSRITPTQKQKDALDRLLRVTEGSR